MSLDAHRPAASARRAAVGVGANLGDARATVLEAIDELAALSMVAGLQASPLYRSAPVEASGPDFFNAVVSFETAASGIELLDALQAIERQHGRKRPFRNAPRTLDLDLLLLGDEGWHDERLTVPHPRMHLRAFVLRPLTDLWPDAVIPGRGRASQWLPSVADQTLYRLPP
jgi:2-amino-4-hydroxy-6-hydroxymethyldihydropteridine diphosphokinase